MLLYEQYFMIYLLGILLVNTKDLKTIFTFIVIDSVLDNILYSTFISPVEYLISISVIELMILIFMLPFIVDLKIRVIFSVCFLMTVINPYFILGIDYFITVDNFLSYYLYIFCQNSSRYANEIFITYLLYTVDRKNIRTNFWVTFTAFNYLVVIATYLKEI